MKPNDTASRSKVLIAGIICAMFLGVIYAWSLFVAPLEAEFGWMRSQTSSIYTVTMMCFAVGAFLSGRLTGWISPRKIEWIAAALIGAGMFMSSCVRELWQFRLFYGVLIGLGIGVGYLTWNGTVMQWFPDRKGFAGGAISMGFGMSNLLLGTAVSRLLSSSLGWRFALRFLGILLPAILLLCSRWLCAPPCLRQAPSGNEGDIDTRAMLRTHVYWLFCLWQCTLSMLGVCIIGQCAPVVTEAGGSIPLATLAVSLVSMGNGLGRILNGLLFDRFGRRLSMHGIPVLYLLCSVAVYLFFQARQPTALTAILLLTGACHGATASTQSMFLASTFGLRYIKQNSSVTSLFLVVSFFASSIAGIIRTSTGSYQFFFLVMGAIAALALVLSFLLRRALHRDQL